MKKFNLKFSRKIDNEWIVMREFYDLRFTDLAECEKFCVEFLRRKRKLRNIKDSLKYSVEEI